MYTLCSFSTMFHYLYLITQKELSYDEDVLTSMPHTLIIAYYTFIIYVDKLFYYHKNINIYITNLCSIIFVFINY